MSSATLTLSLPEELYVRLERTASATKQSLEEVVLHALRLGSPPAWGDAPPEHQLDLAALEKLDDQELFAIAAGRMSADFDRRDALLTAKAEGTITPDGLSELARLRFEEDRFMLRKAHAAALLRWRGRAVPPA
ncbi:MAG: hypothetical protein U0359_20950 [Byssovorax sp.]